MQEEIAESIGASENAEPFRTCRALVRSPTSEACWSVFSANLGDFACPNRDYASEGFNAIVGNKQYKILDAYCFAVESSEGTHKLSASDVKITPWDAKYSYSFESEQGRGMLEVAYSTPAQPSAMLVASISISLEDAAKDAGKFHVLCKPLMALCALGNSNAAEISTVVKNTSALVCRSPQVAACIHSPQSQSAVVLGTTQPWTCKLGFGERVQINGRIVPRQIESESAIAGQLDILPDAGKAVVYCNAFAADCEPELASHYDFEKNSSSSYYIIRSKFSKYIKLASLRWGSHNAALLSKRLYGLSKNFAFEAANLQGYDAGSMWFRQLWLRDCFEALYCSFDFFLMSDPSYVRRLILSSLSMQNDAGLIPTQIGLDGSHNYSGIDSTLLCMLCACKYAEHSSDPEVCKALSAGLSKFLSSASSHKQQTRLVFGLLSCPANYSWTDSQVPLVFGNETVIVPTRIPKEWIGSDAATARQAALSRYFLVEVNAQWVELLRHASILGLPRKHGLDWLHKLALRNFFEVFGRQPGFLPHIAIEEEPFAKACQDFSSMAIVACAFLGKAMPKGKMHKALSHALPYFVYRDSQLFGIPVRATAGSNAPFLGDEQYHGFACWSRDNPYLFKFLVLAGREDLAEQLLLSSLSHQFEESAVGYCSELFAIDSFNNPVPVKNPAQLWSQFAGPYIDFFKLEKKQQF
ncbi:MAG: amylo-alpha-1,6-glucosidase [Candidatus Micrarchaeia archaeon]